MEKEMTAMTVKELISKLQKIQDEIGGDDLTTGSHSYPSNVSFVINNPEIDLDLDLVDIDINTHMGCGCWTGVKFVLKATDWKKESKNIEEKMKIKTNIEIEGNEKHVKEICRMLRWAEYCGNIGHSTSFKFSVDGDGKGQINIEFKDFNEEQKEKLT